MRTFSFEHYAVQNAAMKDSVALLAKVWLDGDTYIVMPNPNVEALAYRIAKQDVRIVEVLSPTSEPTALNEPLYSVAIRRNAPCIRMTAGTIEEFWSVGSEEQHAAARTLRASLDFGANGEGTLSYDGNNRPCLGKTNLAYPRDLTVNVSDKYRRRYSNEFGVWMDYAVLIWGQRGIYIHEGPATLASNGGETAGCIHLAAPHAEEFFNWVTGRTRITISYPW